MIVLALGLLGGLFHYGGMTVERFERAAADEIRSKLRGPEAAVQVRAKLAGDGPLRGKIARVTIDARRFEADGLPLFTEPGRSTRGHVGRLELELQDFTLRGLRVDRLSSVIPDCRFDLPLALRKKQIRLSRSGTGTGRVEILDRDLESFVLRKYSEIKRVTIRITQDRVQVDGYGEFLLLATEFRVNARLTVANGTQLSLADAQITLDGQAADGASRDALLQTLNPVVDLNRDLALYDAVFVESVELRDGRLIASGRTRIPDQPKK